MIGHSIQTWHPYNPNTESTVKSTNPSLHEYGTRIDTPQMALLVMRVHACQGSGSAVLAIKSQTRPSADFSSVVNIA